MKTLKSVLLVSIMMFAIFATNIFPQVKVMPKFDKGDGALLVTLPATNVDSVTTSTTVVQSKWFDLSPYLAQSWTTYPVYYTKLYTSTDGKPYITTTIEFTNNQDSVWAADTLGGVKDSLETLYKGSLTITGNKGKYARIVCKGDSVSATIKNRADATATVNLLFTKP